MQNSEWTLPTGHQLSLGLFDGPMCPPPDPREEFERARNAEELLRQLARALGEVRATMDMEDLQKSLVLSPEPPVTA